MAVTIIQQAYWKLWDENAENASKFDSNDDLDIIYKYPQQLGQGYSQFSIPESELSTNPHNLYRCVPRFATLTNRILSWLTK